MVEIKVDSNAEQVINALKQVSADKWPKVLTKALNNTAKVVLDGMKQKMPSFFDRPTPFTVNSMRIDYAKPEKLEATVKWKDPAGNQGSAGQYLKPDVFGGTRPQKGFERALQAAGLMPSGYMAIPTTEAPRDSYGNVPATYYQAILNYLKANPTTERNNQVAKLKKQGFTKLAFGIAKTVSRYDKVKRREEGQKKRALKYFTAIKGKGTTLASGVYWRDPAFGHDTRMIFAFIPRATYRDIYPFYKQGDDIAQQTFPAKLDEAIQYALRSK